LGQDYRRLQVRLTALSRCFGPLCALAFLALFLSGLPGLAADTAYLREMPSPDRVLRDIRGSNPRDTAARQIAAFQLLTEMEAIRIGQLDANLNLGTVAPEERRMFEGYAQTQRGVYEPIEATFDRNCSGANCEQAKFMALLGSYRNSKPFRDQLASRYFSAAWMADLARADTAIQARLGVQQQALRNSGNPAVITDIGTGGIVAAIGALIYNLSGYLIFGGLVVWWILRRKKRKAVVQHRQEENTNRPAREAKTKSDAEMARLGANQDQRFRAIEDLFNRKTETISIPLNEYDANGAVVLQGTLARPLAAMVAREREMLRAAYHLYNIGELTPWNFHLARLILVFGDGKGQVYDAKFNRTDMTRDFASSFREYTGVTVESAVSTILHCLEQTAKHKPDNPAVRLLSGRLLGGGNMALSSTAEFVAAQTNASTPALLLGIAEDSGKLVTFSGEGSVITVAPPGSGKTQCHVFPTLLSWKGPAVVLDVKGEIYAGTSKWRSQNVGPVYKFAPLDPGSSHCYNPLSAVRSNPEYLWEDSRFLADMMLVPTGAKDPFWENRARDILTASIARACLTDDPARRSLGTVLDVFHGVGWDPFVRELQSCVDIRSMSRAGSSLAEMDRKQRDSVLQTGLSSLSAWDGDRIERATRKSDWSPLDLRGGKNPTIYICLKPNEVESYISVLRVFIAQHIRMLTSSLPPPGAAPILFVLDELPRLRQMPPVEEALEIGRQYGIKLWMFTQSLGQLENAYPNAEGMVGSCALRMYMNPSLHDGTAQKISEDIGFQESVLDNSRQKIVEPPALAGPEYKDFVIIMASGFTPFRLRKSFAYQDPAIAARMGSL
jgi:type IV secretion system protein VirD4